MERSENGSWETEHAEALSVMLLRHSRQYGVIFLDSNGRITGWGQGSHAVTGFSSEDVLGKDASMLFTPEDRARMLDRHELTTARKLGVAEDERWHVRKDGSAFWASGLTLPLFIEGELRGFLKVFKDASHFRSRMKTFENEIQHNVAALNHRDNFLGTIAHELRGPLAPLKAVAQLLSLQDRSGQFHPLVKVIDRQLAFLERLVEDLVDITRLNTGKLTLKYQTVELQAVLKGAVESCRDAASAKSIPIQMVLPPVPIEVDVDPDRVHQVVINLLNNAIKYTPDGGSVTLFSNADQTHFLIHVRDSGRGIGPTLLPRIFDMFTQAEGAKTSRGEGLGIGLALVKEIVSLHYGSVEVRSEGDGKGSEFIARMPLRKPNGSGHEPLPDLR